VNGSQNKRVVADAALECFIDGKAVEAILRDLSTGGAMIEVKGAEASPGDTGLLRFLGLTSMMGRVSWRQRTMIGFEFKNSLHPSVVEYLGFHSDRCAFRDADSQKVA